MTTARK